MTQEEKELLLKDLCARLPYGVKTSSGPGILELTPRTDVTYIVNDGHIPYLRPMSSMTEEECNKYAILVGSVSYSLSLEKIVNYKKVDMSYFTSLSNWLNAHHFDYRGMIEKGLALEAPEGMYKTE